MSTLTLHNLQVTTAGRQLLNFDHGVVEAGELVAIIGPNGAGKSTLLRAISGEFGGAGVWLHGRPLPAWPNRERARHLGVLPQTSQLGFPFTAAEVVALGLIPLALSRADAERLVDETMQATNCQQLARCPYPALSGGERQRVQLARVLLQLSQATRPPLLLLDEPTAAQDLGQQHALLQLARRCCRERGFAVVAVLHDLNQVLRYADRCWLLRDGQLMASGPPSQLLDAAIIKRHWDHPARRVQLDDGLELIV